MITILGALEAEISAFLGLLQRRESLEWRGFPFYLGELEGHDVLVARCGVGKVLAAMFTQHIMDRYQPKALLFTGLAGALDGSLAIGDIVVASDLVQHDMDAQALGFERGRIPYSEWRFIACDSHLQQLALSWPAGVPAASVENSTHASSIPTNEPGSGFMYNPNPRLHNGRICTGDQFISQLGDPRMGHLTGELDGIAVEMEGASVALVCAINEVPCMVARTISDRADGSAPQNFADFLPLASLNSLGLVCHVLRGLPRY